MTAFRQDFFTYPGDTSQPIFTVLDGSGVPINIQTVAEIAWDARRKVADISPAIAKLKSTGGIVLVGGGVTGQLQVNLAPADTTALSGVYLHKVVLTDGLGNVSTVSLGQLTVGRAPVWSFDAAQLATNPLMQVRQIVGDVSYNDQQMFDEQINFAISLRPNSIYGAGAECARFLAAKFSREVDLVQGELKTNYSNKAKAYMALSRQLEQWASIRGPGTAYAGGLSVADKERQEDNTDRIGPNFTIGMTDNLRGGPIGPETPNFNSVDELPDR